MKLLIAGAGGQVGRELVRRAGADGVIAADRAALDLTDREAVRAAIRAAAPAVVVNAAAYTAVDRAESEPDRAFAVNRDGARTLAEACAETGSRLIHVSTDFVFDGKTDRPYREDDPVSPLGVYGRSKAAGEAEIRAAGGDGIIVRTAWVYGVHGKNFVKTMIRLGKEREVLRVVDDQAGCPTCAGDLAAVLLAIAGRIRGGAAAEGGMYHYCGAGIATWHGLAKKALEMAGKYTELAVREVTPISTAEYPTPAPRPAFSALDCGKIAERFGIRARRWENCLGEVVAGILGDCCPPTPKIPPAPKSPLPPFRKGGFQGGKVPLL